MYYTNLKTTTHDTQEQIDHCLECRKVDCTNCIFYLRVGQVPGKDPCDTCYSKSVCTSGTCGAKRDFLREISADRELLDKQFASYGLYKNVLHPGSAIYILHNKNIVRSKIISADKDKITTEHDEYTYQEHGFLWWLTRKQASERNAV